MPPTMSRLSGVTRNNEWKGWLAFGPGKLEQFKPNEVESAPANEDCLISRSALGALLAEPDPDVCGVHRVYGVGPFKPAEGGVGVMMHKYKIKASVDASQAIARFEQLIDVFTDDLPTADEYKRQVRYIDPKTNAEHPTMVMDVPVTIEPAPALVVPPGTRPLNAKFRRLIALVADIARKTSPYFVDDPEVTANRAIVGALREWEDRFESLMWGSIDQEAGKDISVEDASPAGITTNLGKKQESDE